MSNSEAIGIEKQARTGMPKRIQQTGIAAVLAGVLYIGQALIEFVEPQAAVFNSLSDYAIEVAFAAALLFTLAGLIGLYLLHGKRLGRIGMSGFIAATVGTASMFVSAAATAVAGQDALGLFIFIGVLLALVGVILFGIGIIRARVLPRWVGAALLLGLPVTVAVDGPGGAILLGIAWIAIGYALGSKREDESMTSPTAGRSVGGN